MAHRSSLHRHNPPKQRQSPVSPFHAASPPERRTMLPEVAGWLPGWRSVTSTKAPPDPAASDVHLPFSSFLTWIPQSFHPFLRSLLIASLRLGPRPQHVAFIMDGNRRSARERKLPVRVGHEEGFEALKRVLSFLLKLEIPHVTVYAFSIENFNRDPMEVEALMDMARKRLVEICQHGCVRLRRPYSASTLTHFLHTVRY